MPFAREITRVDTLELNDGDRILVGESKRPLCPEAEVEFTKAHEHQAKTATGIRTEEQFPIAVMISDKQDAVRCVVINVASAHMKTPGLREGTFGERSALLQDSSLLNGFIAHARRPREKIPENHVYFVGRPISSEIEERRQALAECFPKIVRCIDNAQLRTVEIGTWLDYANGTAAGVHELLLREALGIPAPKHNAPPLTPETIDIGMRIQTPDSLIVGTIIAIDFDAQEFTIQLEFMSNKPSDRIMVRPFSNLNDLVAV